MPKFLLFLLTLLAAPLLIPYMLIVTWYARGQSEGAVGWVGPSVPLILTCIAIEAALVLLWLRFRR